MFDLMELHKAVASELENNTITEAEADVLYEEMFNDQVRDLILDIYEAFEDGDISESEANAYLGIATEAVKGDKLSSKAKDKINGELKDLPDNERKAIEDSIKKASKESTKKGAAFKIDALSNIDKALKSKKVVKESEEAIINIDSELATFEEKMSEEEKEHLAELAVTGTIVTAITLPFALTFISIAKGFKKVKEGNKYFKEINAIDNQILGVNTKYNDKLNKLRREWEDMYEYSSLFKKYYIPKKNKEKMKELKDRFRKLEDDYNAEVRPLVVKRKELEKKYTEALTSKTVVVK